MKTVLLALTSFLIIYAVIQIAYSFYYFRVARKISKDSFVRSGTFGKSDKPKLTLTIYGDSVGVGVGATKFETALSGRIVEYLSENHEVIFDNKSVSGLKMADLLKSPEANGKQDIIILVISSNDLFRFTNLTQFEKSTATVLKKYSPLADKIIIIGPGRIFDAKVIPFFIRPFYKYFAPKYAKIISEEVKNYPNMVHINPIDPPVNPKDYKGKPSADNFHPSDNGYLFWFDMVKTGL
jgi:lysophospholipase L1-like esterase